MPLLFLENPMASAFFFSKGLLRLPLERVLFDALAHVFSNYGNPAVAHAASGLIWASASHMVIAPVNCVQPPFLNRLARATMETAAHVPKVTHGSTVEEGALERWRASRNNMERTKRRIKEISGEL